MQETMHFISQEHLERWGVTSYEAYEAAQQNLAEMHKVSWGKATPGVYHAACHDSYDTSRLLLIDEIQKLDVEGDFGNGRSNVSRNLANVLQRRIDAAHRQVVFRHLVGQ